MQRVTDALARPWAAWAPEAVPSTELIEHTQFYRVQPRAVEDPALFGDWWPFLLSAMAVYGLAPRLLFLLYATWRVRVCLRRAMPRLPGAGDVLHRLSRERMDTDTGDDAGDAPGQQTTLSLVQPPASGEPYSLIVWAAAVSLEAGGAQWATQQWGLAPTHIWEAGGHRDIAEDAALIESVRESKPGRLNRVAVKA